MQKNYYRMVALFAGILLLAIPLLAQEILLHCNWLNPGDHRMQQMSFSANPLLAILPGNNLQLSCEANGSSGRVAVLRDGQIVREDVSINFTAPESPGSYYIQLQLEANGIRRDAEICVLVPFKAVGRKTAEGYELSVDGENVGHYRHPSRSGNNKVRNNPESYQPPVWWMQITPSNSAFEIAAGLTAAELVVASEDTGKKHTDLVPVCYPMWKTIHTLRNALTTKGIPASALKLISMHRSPPYNRSIGSNAFGRHIFGDAFDFYIDLEGDQKASDLNRDGKLNRYDAYPIIALIEELQDDGKIPVGGIGVYNTIGGDHEVTMHLDMRGHRATWGFLYSASGKRTNFSWASQRFAELDRYEEGLAAARAAKEGRKYYPPKRDPLPDPAATIPTELIRP